MKVGGPPFRKPNPKKWATPEKAKVKNRPLAQRLPHPAAQDLEEKLV
jgi:hypothetical protein